MLELEGTEVLDLTQGMAGPYCTMLLADAGAHVTKVEPLDGDYARRMAPVVDGESAVFLGLNRNKRSIAIDLRGSKSGAILGRLARRAAIVVEDLGQDVTTRLGLNYETLSKDRPIIVYCSISDFGDRGPLAGAPGSELVLQALTGCWAGLGAVHDEPIRVGADIAEINTGGMAFSGILAAIFHRLASGQGQRVSISKFATIMHLRSSMFAARTDPDEWTGRNLSFQLAPRDFGWQTKDKAIFFSLWRGNQEDTDQLLIALGLEQWASHPRFGGGARDVVGLGLHVAEFRHVWEEAFEDKTSEEVTSLIQQAGGGATPVNNYEEVFAHPQIGALNLVREMEHPELGRVKALGSPWEFSNIEESPLEPPPRLGQDTERILQELRYSRREIEAFRNEAVVR